MRCFDAYDEMGVYNYISFDSPFQSKYDEGELNKVRWQFVSKESLAARARALGLGQFILYGTGETETCI